jgi:GTP-binding protein HflX
VLEEIGADGKPTIMVFNKIDRFENGEWQNRFEVQFPHAIGVSAKTGIGIPALLEEVGAQLRPIREFLELKVPHDKAAVIARLHEVGQVIERNYTGKMAKFKARIPPHLHAEFAPFIVQPLQTQ